MRRLCTVLIATALLCACSDETPTSIRPHALALSIVGGDAQEGPVGQELPTPVTVRVEDRKGSKAKPVKGILVNFVVTEGNGRVFAGAAITDADGLASDYWTLGPVAGANRIEVRAVDGDGTRHVFGTFVATGVAPTPPADLPPADCIDVWEVCSALTTFEPRSGPGYLDYPINGESPDNQYRSYLRLYAVMAVKHAAAVVASTAADWPGNGGALGLGDMSEWNGAIPGTSLEEPAHPEGTHTNGLDIDVAYFQTGTADNLLRTICVVGTHACQQAPHLLDAQRTALFLAALARNPRLRVVFVDPLALPPLEAALDALVGAGLITSAERSAVPVAYQPEHLFQNDHMHVSFR